MRILVTGGTGSIGQVLVYKLLKRTGDTICIFSRDEQKQDAMAEKFNNHPRLRFFLGDIRDKDRVAFALEGVDVVIHTAALKIVPALEYNPMEAVKTNITGTQNIIEGVINVGTKVVRDKRGNQKNRCGWPKVIALSTDKAVSPVNLYGATKLCLEKLVIAANNLSSPFRFSVVRYGNVALSRGSVIPKFMQQYLHAEQLTITDERMTRFWITLDEASDFVVRCLDNMQGGEVFIPNMTSFRVQDVATLIAGKNNYVVTGIRPGEKIHETIISEDEYSLARYDRVNKYYVIRNRDIHDYSKGQEISYEDRLRGPLTSANFIMNMDELKDKLVYNGVIAEKGQEDAPHRPRKKNRKCLPPSKLLKTSRKK